MEPNIEWKVVEPGIIELPTTSYRIHSEITSRTYFIVTWHGNHVGTYLGLKPAKDRAMFHMAEMIQMGHTP